MMAYSYKDIYQTDFKDYPDCFSKLTLVHKLFPLSCFDDVHQVFHTKFSQINSKLIIKKNTHTHIGSSHTY